MNILHPIDPKSTLAWMDHVNIRPAQEQDLLPMEWDGAYTRYRNVYADVYERMQRGRALMWVAELSEHPKLSSPTIIGQAFAQLKMHDKSCANGKTRAYVHSFRVHPDWRKAGLGTLIMQTVEKALIARGFSEITLNVARNNESALRLYRRMGYQIIKKLSGRWSYSDENNILRHEVEPSYRMKKRFPK